MNTNAESRIFFFYILIRQTLCMDSGRLYPSSTYQVSLLCQNARERENVYDKFKYRKEMCRRESKRRNCNHRGDLRGAETHRGRDQQTLKNDHVPNWRNGFALLRPVNKRSKLMIKMDASNTIIIDCRTIFNLRIAIAWLGGPFAVSAKSDGMRIDFVL